MSSNSVEVVNDTTNVEVTHTDVNVDVITQSFATVEITTGGAAIEVITDALGNVEVLNQELGALEVNPQVIGNIEVDAVGIQGGPGPQGIPGIGKVDSVNGDEGPNVVIGKAEIGLPNVDNTSDANKPVSTAQQAALDLKAPIASPTFTGTVGGITKAMVGLANVDNTSDAAKPISTATQTALNAKAPLASPTFTGTVSGITKAMVGLGSVQDTAQVDLVNNQTIGGVKTFSSGPIVPDGSWAIAKTSGLQSALDLKAPLASPTFTGTVSGITKAMVGLSNVDNTTDADKPISTATQTALDLKAPLASPTFTGTVSGITKAMVGLSNVDNTTDAAKPVSTATQTALNAKANLASPTFTGTVSGITATMVGLGNVANLAQVDLVNAQTIAGIKTFSSAPVVPDASWTIAKTSGLQSALDLKAPLASPTFTGTVSGITKTMVGLSNVDNTSDVNKPVSTAQQTALNLKANISSLHAVATSGSYTDLVSKPFIPAQFSDLTGTLPTSALPPLAINEVTAVADEAAMLALNAQRGDMAIRLDGAGTFVLASDSPTTLADWKNIATPAAVTSVAGKTGAVTLVKGDVGLGNVDNTSDANKPVSTAQQTALNAKANLASPTFTGTVSGITKSMVGLANVDNTADTAKPVSTAQQTALDLKAPLASPTFTGTVSGITKSMVGLGSVDNTADTAKPVSTAQQNALNLKANLASPAFTGTPTFNGVQSVVTRGFLLGGYPALTRVPSSEATLLGNNVVAGDTASMIKRVDATNDGTYLQLHFSRGLEYGVLSTTAGTEVADTTGTVFSVTKLGAVTGTSFDGDGSALTGLTKAQVGLANVDNTADTAKPVSTAQQTALNLKANLASPTFTGTVTAAALTTTGLVSMDGNDYQTFGAVGVAAPAFTTRSVGTKIVLYEAVAAASADYAIGIESATLWNSIPTASSTSYFKWYGGTTTAMTLTGAGALTVVGQGVFSGGINNTPWMEIGNQAAASTPYIDFHSGATFVDYDARIIASGGTGSTGGGTLNIAAGALQFNGTAISVSGHTHDDRYYTETEADGRYIIGGTSQIETGQTEIRRDDTGTDWSNSTFSLSNNTGHPQVSFHIPGVRAYGLRFHRTSAEFEFVNQAGTALTTVRGLLNAGDLNAGTVPQARTVPNIQRVYYTGTAPARPTGSTYVEWVGPNAPTGMVAGDTWVATA